MISWCLLNVIFIFNDNDNNIYVFLNFIIKLYMVRGGVFVYFIFVFFEYFFMFCKMIILYK